MWRDQWVSRVGRVVGGEAWQEDLPKDPRRLQRPIGLTIDLVEEIYSPIIAIDNMDEEEEGWGCRLCRMRHPGGLQTIEVVKSCPKGRPVKPRNAQRQCKKNPEGKVSG